MGVSKKKSLERSITKRDIDILYYLGANGFATRQEIFDNFWIGSPSSCNHHRRIRHLMGLNLIEQVKGDRTNLGIKLTDEGLSFLQDSHVEAKDLKSLKRSYRSQFNHDQTVQRILNTLEESPLVIQTETEKQLIRRIYGKRSYRVGKKERSKLPDALVLIETPGGLKWTALEVELSRKSNNRYTSIFSNHLTNKNWDIVLYFVKNPELMKVVTETYNYCLKNDPAVRFSEKVNGVYFVGLDDFLEKKTKAIFANSDDQFSFNDLTNKMKSRAKVKSVS